MKVYVICDIEGVAGVCDQAHQCSFNHDEYREQYVAGSFGPFYLQARRLATLELNALIEGALEGGATDIWAWDGHCRFPGGLDIELLHPAARMVMNAGDGGPAGLDGSFDAILMQGLHAKQGAPGAPQAHTLFHGLEWMGSEIGEIGMTCAQGAVHGVPVIFISGDSAAVAEARQFVPGIEAVVTKEALFSHTARLFDAVPQLSLSPIRSRELIREATRRAFGRIAEIGLPPMPPFDPLAE